MAEKIVKDSQGLAKDLVNDCISRKAAIDAICRDGVRLERGGALMITISTAKQWAVDLLGKLPSAQSGEDIRAMCGECDAWNQYKNYPQPGWIPWNSGRFPEESGTYTVTAYDGATKRVTYAKYQKRLKRWELTGARAYWRVLAWMPLPAQYRTEGDDNHEG